MVPIQIFYLPAPTVAQVQCQVQAKVPWVDPSLALDPLSLMDSAPVVQVCQVLALLQTVVPLGLLLVIFVVSHLLVDLDPQVLHFHLAPVPMDPVALMDRLTVGPLVLMDLTINS